MRVYNYMAMALLTVACGSQDPRSSRILIAGDSEDLYVPTQQALDFWHKAAPGQLDVEISDTCDQGQYQCIFIDWAYLDSKEDGICHRRYVKNIGTEESASIIHISNKIKGHDDRVLHVVAHELGHAFNLNHAENLQDVMTLKTGFCITQETSDSWHDMYNGDSLKEICVDEDP